MFHIVESCPMTKLNGGLSRLSSADEDDVLWLTSYGSWHAYEKKKKLIFCVFSFGVLTTDGWISGRASALENICSICLRILLWIVDTFDGPQVDWMWEHLSPLQACCWFANIYYNCFISNLPCLVHFIEPLLLQLGELEHRMILVTPQISCRTPRTGFGSWNLKLRWDRFPINPLMGTGNYSATSNMKLAVDG